MSHATLAVVGSKEVVLIVLSSLSMLGIVTAAVIVLVKLMKREPGRRRDAN